MGILATAVGCTVRMPGDALIASSSGGILHFVQDDKMWFQDDKAWFRMARCSSGWMRECGSRRID
jgi:hypothetical protein